MAKEYTQDELLRKAASYCSIAEHCIEDVNNKLQKWNVPAEWHEPIIDRLIADGFIDENRYAKAFVVDKFRLNKWGKTKIALALKLKGVSKEDISEALELIDEGEYDDGRYGCLAKWLGNGNKFYAIREDARKVEELWLVDVLAEPRPELYTYKAELAGDKEVIQYELLIFQNLKQIHLHHQHF